MQSVTYYFYFFFVCLAQGCVMRLVCSALLCLLACLLMPIPLASQCDENKAECVSLCRQYISLSTTKTPVMPPRGNTW